MMFAAVQWNSSYQYPHSTEQNGNIATRSLNLATNVTTVPTGCIVVKFEEYIPWNNPDNLISLEAEELVFTLKVLLFLPVAFLFGFPANIINMIVFYKQGLKERINVCLFALALADEGNLVNSMLWFADQFYLRFTTREKQGPVLTFFTNNHLVGFHGFIWVSQVLSAIIATDRFFCVLKPLRSQEILRTSRMVVIIIAVYVVVLGLVFLEMMRYTIVCAYDPLTGKTKSETASSEFYFHHKELIENLDVFVLGIGLPGIVMIVVSVTTLLTTVKLRQAALWRATTSSSSGVSQRDIALTKMLVANSVFFIVCVIPFTVFRQDHHQFVTAGISVHNLGHAFIILGFIFLFMPKVNAGGRQHNLFLVAQYILLTISYFNSSFNFIVYYTMGSRFRQTFWQLFGQTMKSDNSKIKNKVKETV